MIELLFQLESDSGGRLKIVRGVEELNQCLQAGIMAAILHFEGAEAIDPDLGNLDLYYEKGLRSLGLTWSRSNAFANGVPFAFPHSPDTGPGLTGFGKELVKKCNYLGILLDISHLNEKGFWDVAEISDSPLVATHSGVHALCQSTRNLTDQQLDAVAASDGIIGVNFHVGFLRSDGKPDADTPLSVIVNHIDYIAERIGIDHVGLGSDFDGATMPNELGDVSGLPKLITSLIERGYAEDHLQKICNGNWLRVLELTWN